MGLKTNIKMLNTQKLSEWAKEFLERIILFLKIYIFFNFYVLFLRPKGNDLEFKL